jgi:hypothetical protein
MTFDEILCAKIGHVCEVKGEQKNVKRRGVENVVL